jgi:nucleotide-binding universal stress UspA family protein
METLLLTATSPELGVRASKAAPIIVATDGQTQSDAALFVGLMLAGAPAAIKVVSVIKPMPMVAESMMVMGDDLIRSRRAEVQRQVIQQMIRVWDRLEPFEIQEGEPATLVGKFAHQSCATMIVCGLGQHRVADRLFGDETALRLIKAADVPVLATSEHLDRAPARIIVACDFSETSFRAARAAIELAAPSATLHLVHCCPRGSNLSSGDGSPQTYRQDAEDTLVALAEQLRPPADMVMERVVLEGDPATEILAFAASVRADLIATGSHGRGFVTRMFVGSVATRIVRGSNCSVLAVPHGAVMTDVGIPFSHRRNLMGLMS